MLGELFAGRYQIIEELEAGGFGQTYIVEDIQRPGNPRCVLKQLTFASRNTEVLQQVRRLFRAEAETLEKLGQHDQIPRLLAYFEADEEFYLVQEFIAGQSLSKELKEGVRWTEAQVVSFLEDALNILEFVHGQGVIHRDIKPDNLIRRPDHKLVLIDFGAVKTIPNVVAEATGETALSIPIYTSGYGASEQCLGRPRYNSDLYSLGMVAIQALTGMRPSQLPQDLHTCEVIWRDQAIVSDPVAEVLERMTRFHSNQRYQSATEALQALQHSQVAYDAPLSLVSDTAQVNPMPLTETIVQPQARAVLVDRNENRRLPWQTIVAGSAIALVGVVITRLFWQAKFPPVSPAAMVSPTEALGDVSDRISLGEKLLNRWQPSSLKQEGVEQLAAGNFALAVKKLEVARQKDLSDPETLIYLNNARVGSSKAYTIAAVAPIGDTFGSSQEILRGVAQAQETVNRAGGINGVPLRVAIANEDNKPATSRRLAESLAKNPDILGVVGHSISDNSLAAADVYQAHQLVMVSPMSSAVQLSNKGSYIFRTIPSDRTTAKALGDYMLTRLKKRKVVVFYNSLSAYSQSLKTEFRNALFYNGVEPIAEVDLSRPDFDAFESWQRALSQGAEAVMLAPDFTTFDRAIQVVIVNQRRLKVLAGESVSTSKILTIAGSSAAGMVLAIPATLKSPSFRQQFTNLWGQKAAIGWRTVISYDAASALIGGLKREATRAGVQRSLADPKFSVAGAENPISFLESGDRQSSSYLMTVVPQKPGTSTIYEFKPLP
jgi:ABC-type branched-subunit amino acid transport system substrate-binding protein/serine/threonine protein kinase